MHNHFSRCAIDGRHHFIYDIPIGKGPWRIDDDIKQKVKICGILRRNFAGLMAPEKPMGIR
jgi:hypothetical protein